MVKIILGLFLAGFGTFLAIKSEAFFRIFGRLAFAEKYLGAEGGSRLFYQLLGILLIFIGFMFMTGMVDGVFEWMAINLFGSLGPN